MLPQFAVVKALLGGVRWYVWVIAVVVAWGAWNRHQFRSEQTDFNNAKIAAAAERAASAAEVAAENARRAREKQEITDAANQKAARLEAALRDRTGTADKLRARLAALDAERCSGGAAAVEGSASAAAAGDLSAYVRRRLDEARERTIEFADRAALAGETCELEYDSLKKKPPK